MTESIPIIDAHTHIDSQQAALAVEIMDRAGVASAVVCAWGWGFGEALDWHVRRFNEFPGRFHIFGNIDFSRIDRPDFSACAADELRRGVDAGIRGLKVYKRLGLVHRDGAGRLLRVDDGRLDAVWAAAGECGIPVLIHTADPRAFWQPIDRHNAWGAVLAGEPEWSYYRRGLPSREELLGERDAVIRRHPGTAFIAPHLASLEDDFLALGESLEAMPNLCVDISARILHMGATPRRRRAARELLTEFPGRFLYATDTVLRAGQRPDGIQPQTFYTPDRLPPEYARGDQTLAATSVWFYEYHRLFLATGQVQRPIPFLCNDPETSVTGLALPGAVLCQICHENIERLLGL